MTASVILWASFALFLMTYFGWLKLPKEVERKRFSFFPLAGAFLLFFALQMALFPLGYVLIYGKGPQGADLDIYNVIAISSSIACLLGFTGLMGKNIYHQIWGEGLWIRNLRRGVFTWFLAFPFVIIVSCLTTAAVEWGTGQVLDDYSQSAVQYLENLLDRPFLFVAMAIVLAGLIPIGEEVLFRGFLYNWMKGVMKRGTAIFLTAFLFALLLFSSFALKFFSSSFLSLNPKPHHRYTHHIERHM